MISVLTIASLCSSLCFAATVDVTLTTSLTVVETTDPGYASFNFDWWTPKLMCEQPTCKHRPGYPKDGCPAFSAIATNRNWDSAGALEVDLDSQQLQYLALSLTTATKELFGTYLNGRKGGYLRVGGSPADFVVYDVPAGQAAGCDWLCLTMDRFELIYSFAMTAEAGLTFGIADLYGITPPHSGAWNSSNAEQLLRYAHQRGVVIDTVELGNEPTSCFSYTHASDLATRLKQLDKVLTSVYGPKEAGPASDRRDSAGVTSGNPSTPRPKIAVPDIDPKYISFIVDMLNETAGLGIIDAVTLHNYGTESNLPTNLREPSVLDAVVEPWGWVVGNVSQLQPEILKSKSGIWLGETGPAGSSGRQNETDAFMSSLWYADSLGLTARLGGKRHHRQALTGGWYELVDHTRGFEPNPDYWMLYFFKSVMGDGSLDLQSSSKHDVLPGNNSGAQDSPSYLRSYLHCVTDTSGSCASDVPAGGVLINLSNDTAFSVTLQSSQDGSAGAAGSEFSMLSGPRREWHLTGADGAGMESLYSRRVLLGNTTVIQLTSDGSIPKMPHSQSDWSAPVVVQPLSVVFIQSGQ